MLDCLELNKFIEARNKCRMEFESNKCINDPKLLKEVTLYFILNRLVLTHFLLRKLMKLNKSDNFLKRILFKASYFLRIPLKASART